MLKGLLSALLVLIMLTACGRARDTADQLHSFDPADIQIAPNQTCILTMSPSQRVVLVSDVDVSKTAIAFNLLNNTDARFNYSALYRLAKYLDGIWVNAPTVGMAPPTGLGGQLNSGDVRAERVSFHPSWHGNLSPGRYMYIRSLMSTCRYSLCPRCWLSNCSSSEHLLVEFTIDENTPLHLPPESRVSDRGWPPAPFEHLTTPAHITVAGYSGLSPTGISLTFENDSPYNFTFDSSATLQHYTNGIWRSIEPMARRYSQTMELAANSQTTVQFNWAEFYGALPRGKYQLVSSFASPPTGRMITHTFTIDMEPEGDYPISRTFIPQMVVIESYATPYSLRLTWENRSRTTLTPTPLVTLLRCTGHGYEEISPWRITGHRFSPNWAAPGGRLETYVNWQTPIGTLEPGRYKLFIDFIHDIWLVNCADFWYSFEIE